MTKQRWTESSCVLCKLVQHIPIICHTKLFGQCYNKNLLIFYLFWCFFKLCQSAASFNMIFFFKKFKIGWYSTKYKKSALENPVICTLVCQITGPSRLLIFGIFSHLDMLIKHTPLINFRDFVNRDVY